MKTTPLTTISTIVLDLGVINKGKIMKNNLKEIRESAGVSVRDLHERAGVAQGMIRQMESGGDIVSLCDAYAIAAVLGTDVYTIWPDCLRVETKTVTVRTVVEG